MTHPNERWMKLLEGDILFFSYPHIQIFFCPACFSLTVTNPQRPIQQHKSLTIKANALH